MLVLLVHIVIVGTLQQDRYCVLIGTPELGHDLAFHEMEDLLLLGLAESCSDEALCIMIRIKATETSSVLLIDLHMVYFRVQSIVMSVDACEVYCLIQSDWLLRNLCMRDV